MLTSFSKGVLMHNLSNRKEFDNERTCKDLFHIIRVRYELEVSFKCVKTQPNVLEKVRVCEGDQQSIACPGKRKIDIEYANYGRLKGGHICGIFAWTKDCHGILALSGCKPYAK
ncbi:hypothetical protein ACROYT_G016785 [Oculina patagonica]